MTLVKLQADFFKKPQTWTKGEIIFLLRYYPLYKHNPSHYTASTLRGHLKSRTMSAISKKYWSICGATGKKHEDPKQYVMDFYRDRIEAPKPRKENG